MPFLNAGCITSYSPLCVASCEELAGNNLIQSERECSDTIHCGTKVFGVMDPVSLHKWLDTSILIGIAAHKGFHTQTDLDIAITFARHVSSISFYVVVCFDVHPSNPHFRLDKVRRIFRCILSYLKGIAAFY